MARPYLLTYQDLIDHLVDFVGGTSEEAAVRQMRGAIQSAYRELISARAWKYYFTPGRIVTQAPYSTGTIEYDQTGGTVERKVTLTGGTWPTWAASGRLLIGDAFHAVATRESSTVLTLDPMINPGADIASGTSYSLVQDIYSLPNDFRALAQIYTADKNVLEYVTPDEWLDITTNIPSGGTPLRYTIMSDPDLLSAFAVFLDRYPTAAETLDFVYQRQARQLRHTGYGTGETSTPAATSSVSVTVDTASVTGSGTAFTDAMIGSVIRFSGSSAVPTGLNDTNPYVEQRVIVDVASATALTLDAAVPQTFTSVGYTISDPIDIDTVLIEALLRGCERQLAITRNMKSLPNVEQMYRQARVRAMESDSRVQVPRSPGEYHVGYDRLLTPDLGPNRG